MKTKSEQWVEALAWDNKTIGVPTVVSREIQKQAAKAMKKAKPFKASIKMPKGEKIKPTSKLKKEFDRVFSLFIRQRDCENNGLGQCVTCGVIRFDSQLQAGHYVPRQFLATRWDETNVHAQCGACNGFRGGEPEKMASYIDAMYGPAHSAALTAKRKLKFSPTRQWLENKIAEYNRKIK